MRHISLFVNVCVRLSSYCRYYIEFNAKNEQLLRQNERKEWQRECVRAPFQWQSLGVHYLIKCDDLYDIIWKHAIFLDHFFSTFSFVHMTICTFRFWWRSFHKTLLRRVAALFLATAFQVKWKMPFINLLLYTAVNSCGIIAQWLGDIYGLQVLIIFHLECLSRFAFSTIFAVQPGNRNFSRK